MNSGNQKTARIYQFPNSPRAQRRLSPIARLEAEASVFGSVDFGSGWYHEEEIAKCKNPTRRTKR